MRDTCYKGPIPSPYDDLEEAEQSLIGLLDTIDDWASELRHNVRGVRNVLTGR